MCGIVGYFSFKRNPINPDNIYKMLNAIRHRGPDDTGIAFFNTNTRKITDVPYGDAYDGVIGFQRLSIRELSSNGHQPLISKGKNVILAFNGENAGINQRYLFYCYLRLSFGNIIFDS